MCGWMDQWKVPNSFVSSSFFSTQLISLSFFVCVCGKSFYNVSCIHQRDIHVELVNDERIEEFGRCYIPKVIMKQERLSSGMTIILSTSIRGEVSAVKYSNCVGLLFCCSCVGETISFKFYHSFVSLLL